MKNKVTVQNIADELQLSRTTVSKVLNNAANVSPSTRELVLRKARELNYKNCGRYSASIQDSSSNAMGFAFFLHKFPDAVHIGSSIMSQMEQELRQNGYTMSLHLINDSDLANLTLPPNFYINQVSAIVCIEVFNDSYSKLLSSLGVPILFIDTCVQFHDLGLKADLIMYENIYSTRQMISKIYERKHISTAGVVGDINHCLSFRQRYDGFRLCVEQYQIDNRGYNIIADDSLYTDGNWLAKQVKQMDSLPDLFFCLNDILAFRLIEVLENLGYKVPKNILVCGYDGLPTYNSKPSTLTTVQTSGRDIGITAAHILLDKIDNPCETTCTTYLTPTINLRNSTE
jgi:LacI family transcriptional regulator